MTKILKPDSPLHQLNNLFPTGIPTVADEPQLTLYNQPYWELDLQKLSQPQLQLLAAIVMQDTVPLAIQVTLVSAGIVVIPDKWMLCNFNQN